MKTRQLIVLISACVITVALRFAEIPLWNFGSMAALALLCGTVIRHPAGILLPLGIRLLTDVLIQMKTGYGFFSSWPLDYAAYILIFFIIGKRIAPRRASMVVSGSLASVAVYFLMSNFGVWWLGTMYPPTLAGLMSCYTMAIPFANGTLAGNMLFAPLFYVAWNMATASEPIVARVATAEK